MKFKKIKLQNLFKKELVFLYILIIVGSYLRLGGIFTNSFAFTYDAGRDMLALWDIQHLYKLSLIGPTTGLTGVFYGPWWYLILFPFYFILGGDPQGLTFVIALFGIFTIFFAYTFGKKLGGTLLGLTFASLISVSSALASLSSQIWSPNIVPIFIIFVLYCLYEIYSKKLPKSRFFFLLGFLLALALESGIVFGFLFLSGIILSLILLLNKNLTLKSITSFLLGIFVIFSPRIIFEFRHQFFMTKSFINFLAAGDSSKNYQFVETLIDRVNILFNNFNYTIALDNKILGFVMIIFILLTLTVLFRNASEISKKFIKTSLIIIFTFLMGMTFFKHDIWSHYLVGLPIIFILLFSISISLIGQKTKNYILTGLIVVFLFLVNLNPVYLMNNFNKPLWVGDASVYRNQLEIIDYVYKESAGKNFKYVVYTPPVHDYIYRYLFKWYGQKKYHYSSSEGSRLAYFVLEPDRQYPFRLDDWLKQRERDGKIIKIQKLDSGIIVQTRIH